MKIAVFGLGYVGLANAVLLSRDNEVMAVDVIPGKVRMINCGVSPIADRDISRFLEEGSICLSAVLEPSIALDKARFAVIATPTNYDETTDQFDTSSVESTLEMISASGSHATVVIKSTVPVGFTERMRKRFPDLVILFSPEFLREGKALHDNLYPSRIIVAGEAEEARVFAGLMVQGAEKEAPVLILDTTEAEAVKLFSNTYLALRVAYFNELDTFALERGLDSSQIVQGVSLDPRVGDFYNNPSFGYGGYCLPKDTKQLRSNYGDIPQKLMTAVVESNDTRIEYLADRIVRRNPKRVGVFKLAMKSGSDNARSSSILRVIELLRANGISVTVFDPVLSKEDYPSLHFENRLENFKESADVIICNRWSPELEDVREKVYTRDLFGRD